MLMTQWLTYYTEPVTPDMFSLKEYNRKIKKWDTVPELRKYLDLFTAYVRKTNNACDAEQDSYDVAILFTGRGDDLKDVKKG